MRFLVFLLSLTPLFSLACSTENTSGLSAFKTQSIYGEISHIEVYYPLDYGDAQAFRAEISFESNFDQPVLTVPTFVNEPLDLEHSPELRPYRVSTFQLATNMLVKASIAIYYKFPKRDDGLITFCMGPRVIYKISDLPEKSL
ncbi:hypothetical protein CWC02_11105 [Pseudoalteromonas sp. S2721]|uniref:hypothetical protein n=1 Tax=Pseudoalteromonas sp. S2721 TaxID=579526 RepID=UPI00110B853D|nr:hypothetical protein [Pseudoalteromonas sp. S2721]TMP18009.1 hypothetical protein CWC02_11105 [Pseudoalteromonas sp. S2721]